VAFEDTWHWKGAGSTYDDLIPRRARRFPKCFRRPRSFIGENLMMAYLVMMAVRLSLKSVKAAARLHRLIFRFFAQVREVLYLHSRYKVVIWNVSSQYPEYECYQE